MHKYESCCKVGRVADKYNLNESISESDINEVLLNRWLGRVQHPETAVRPLADWFNKKVLKEVYITHGRRTIEPQLDTDYEVLTGDDGDRKWLLKQDLDDEEIDPDMLTNDFISSSTLYRHLTECLDESKQKEKKETNWEQKKIKYVKDTAAEQASEALRSWENKNALSGATDADISVSIYLDCPECSTSVSVVQARQRGFICKEHLGSFPDDKSE